MAFNPPVRARAAAIALSVAALFAAASFACASPPGWMTPADMISLKASSGVIEISMTFFVGR